MTPNPLLRIANKRNLLLMKAPAILAAILFAAVPTILPAQPPPEATTAFNAYIATVESRLVQQHQSPATYLAPTQSAPPSQVLIEPVATPQLPGAILHHWRATTFVPGATAAAFDHLLRNIDAYPRIYAPQVLQARTLTQQPDCLRALLRVRQHHILTVVLDTTYDVTFHRLDPRHGDSASRSIRIAEIDSPNTPAENALSPAAEHGFLWRQNTYWSYEEHDGGLTLQVESVSLTRTIPTGLGWAVRPFIESIPRESLEFTLRATANTLHP